MMILWHNPSCTKSRQTLAILQDAGVSLTIRHFLDDQPSAAEIEAARTALGVSTIAMARKGEKLFKELGLSTDTQDSDLVAAMAAHPILIERPIAFSGERAIIGRPPEAVKALL